jgi:hypothetical protein
VAESSAGFHESADVLQPSTKDRHRAIVSLMEELEAVDWYDQRIDAAWDRFLRTYLFSEGPIADLEQAVEAGETGGADEAGGRSPSLGLGALTGKEML